MILDHMKLSQLERNRILVGAGFAADGADLGIASEKRQMTYSQAVAEVQAARWPSWVVGDMVEIITANQLGKAMWGFDPADPTLTAIDRNVMSYATTLLPKRIVNWNEMAAGQIAAWKAHFRGGEDLDAPSAYFAPVLERILSGDPEYVDRFIDLWRAVPAYYPPGFRWQYTMVWQEPGLPQMRFQGTSWVVNEVDGLDIDDWYPLDAQTWDAVEALRGRIEASGH